MADEGDQIADWQISEDITVSVECSEQIQQKYEPSQISELIGNLLRSLNDIALGDYARLAFEGGAIVDHGNNVQFRMELQSEAPQAQLTQLDYAHPPVALVGLDEQGWPVW